MVFGGRFKTELQLHATNLFFVETGIKTRIYAAEMAVQYAALSACRKVHVCHSNSLGGAT